MGAYRGAVSLRPALASEGWERSLAHHAEDAGHYDDDEEPDGPSEVAGTCKESKGPMAKIPSSTVQQEAPPAPEPSAIPPGDGESERRASEIVELDAEEGETAKAVESAGVRDQAREAGAAREPNEPAAGTSASADLPSAAERALATVASAAARPAQEPGGRTPADDRTAFKVVLTIKPAAEGRWHATIAVGRDGCDPYWEPADVADWQDALDGVVGVQAAAESRWAEQPRNKMALPPQASRAGASKATPTSTTPPAAGKASRTTARGDADANRKRSAPGTPGKGKETPPASSMPTDGTVQRAEERPESPPPPIGGVEKLALF